MATESYGTLHRLLDSGAIDDPARTHLIVACVELDKRDEALELFAKLSNPALRRAARRDLARRGWIDATPAPDELERPAVATESEPTCRERYADAVEHLLDDRMPWAAIGGTVAFPLVLAIGMLLVSIDDSVLVRLLAAAPALFLLGMVGVVGRHVLLAAMQGLEGADEKLDLRAIAAETPRVLLQVMALGVLFLGPGAAALLLDLWPLALLLLPIGLLLLPMAAALLLATGNWRVLRPAMLREALRRAGRPWLRTVVAILPLVLPALLGFVWSLGRPVFTIIAIVGPLGVAPLLMAARIFGLCIHRQRHAFAGWLGLPTTVSTATPKPAPKPAPPRQPQQPRQQTPQHGPSGPTPAAPPPAAAASQTTSSPS
jgi:hypothetical protein